MKKKLALFLLLALLPINVFASTQKLATLYLPGTNLKKVVVCGTPGIFDGGWKLWTNNLGYAVVTDFGPRLSSSITSVQSTIPVTSMSTKDGHTLVMTDFGLVVYLTIEPGASKEEIVSCTGISSLTFTGCTRGLAFYGTSTAAVAANQKSHQSGSSVILSNVHYVYQQFVDRDTNQTIGGIKSFIGNAIDFSYLPTSTTTTPTNNNQLVTKSYADLLTGTSSYWLPSGQNIYNANTGNVGIGSIPTAGYKLYVLSTSTTANTFGIYSSVRNSAVATVNNVYGYLSQPTNTGIAQNVYGYYTDWNNSGTTTNRYGMYIENGSGTGTTTNNYGLYIENQTKGSTTNDAIYSGGPNVFAGTTTISGGLSAATTTFSVFPATPNSYPTASTSVANKGYVDSGIYSTITNGVFTKNMADANGATTTIAHGLGRLPKRLKISCRAANATAIITSSNGSYNGSTYAVAYGGFSNATDNSNANTSNIAYLINNSATNGYQKATVSWDTTNFVLTWTTNGSQSGNVFCMWEIN